MIQTRYILNDVYHNNTNYKPSYTTFYQKKMSDFKITVHPLNESIETIFCNLYVLKYGT